MISMDRWLTLKNIEYKESIKATKYDFKILFNRKG